MDDSCAVCADNLEWVAYGACGHREVCSTCVARLRVICEDRRCCICKTENDVVFVTKALGDYTRMINDFSVLPTELREGKVGPYWYHEATQAFFDDVDHYWMIKAMCKLSCSICDNMDEQQNDGSKHRGKFRNIEQLKGHLFHRHKLRMCCLCLEGRKVFICEQKLYTRVQLDQHISTGDSEVDGSESERGGFNGHPTCKFCMTPFYGENELYSHMSTEHYTCHICQRQNPGNFEYFPNYDHLENHFREEHHLCEDEACLAKKFIVFPSEAELKRHNVIEHAGRMSRAKRNAAVQIPTSFQYRPSSENNRRGRGRGRSFRPERSDYQLSMAIAASLVETTNEPASSSGQVHSDRGDASNVDPIVQPFEALSVTDSEPPSRYRNAAAQGSSSVPLEESYFPPLSGASSTSQQRNSEALPTNTMASNLRRQRKVNVLNSGQAWPAASRRQVQPSTDVVQIRPTSTASHGATSSGAVPSHANPALGKARSTTVNGWVSSGSSASSGNSSRISHSASAPNLADSRPSLPSISDFPPVSTTQIRKLPSNSQAPAPSIPSVSDFPPVSMTQTRKLPPDSQAPVPSIPYVSDFPPVSTTQTRKFPSNRHASAPSLPSISDFLPVSSTQIRKLPSSSQAPAKVEDVQTANKTLVEKIRDALGHDEDKYTAFKEISGQYRQGLIDTRKYLDYVEQYKLSHLLLELARLCPDVQKQGELIESYNAGMRSNGLQLKEDNGFKKGKGKAPVIKGNSSKEKLADSIISTVRELQSNGKVPEEEVEVLSKDGYRASRGKSPAELSSQNQAAVPTAGGSGGGGKKKKTSKFHRLRLGDGSMEAVLDLKNSEPDPEPEQLDRRLDGNQNSTGGLPVRGVWKTRGSVKTCFLKDSVR